jgi:SAM-dependent methyltransferase
MADQDNSAQIEYWNDKAAVTWTAMQDRLDAMFAQLTALAIDAAAPAVDQRVVDVGCGCGATVLELARRVGQGGQVLGVDVSAPMAERARQRISAAGFGNAQVLVSDASTHAFAAGQADLLFSRCRPGGGVHQSAPRPAARRAPAVRNVAADGGKPMVLSPGPGGRAPAAALAAHGAQRARAVRLCRPGPRPAHPVVGRVDGCGIHPPGRSDAARGARPGCRGSRIRDPRRYIGPRAG